MVKISQCTFVKGKTQKQCERNCEKDKDLCKQHLAYERQKEKQLIKIN